MINSGVEFNLKQYLINEIPAITFISNGYSPNSPQECVAVIGTGGSTQHNFDRTDWSVQILSRADSKFQARRNSYDVYEKLKNRFGLTLPAVTVGGVLYESFIAWQIIPIQVPGYIGADNNSREMFSFNITLTTE